MGIDYESSRLIAVRKRYINFEQTEEAYDNTRIFIAFTAAQLFAIGWNLLRNKCTGEEEELLYRQIFKRIGKNKNDSIEPGEYGGFLKTILKQHTGEIENEKWLKRIIKYLENMGKFRNEQAHGSVNEENQLSSYLENSEAIIEEYQKLFENEICDYLKLCQGTKIGSVRAYQLQQWDRNGPNDAILIDQSAIESWKEPEKELFYRVTDQMTGKSQFFCLSPFISAGTQEEFIDYNPKFWIYQHVQNIFNSELYYYSTQKGREKENRRVEEYSFADLFLNLHKSLRDELKNNSGNNGWKKSGKIKINISYYPGWQGVCTAGYEYLTDICPAHERAIHFCKDVNQRCLYIFGNGGVGKTALVLYIINRFLWHEEYFTNIIFLSAKRQVIHVEDTTYATKNLEKVDISSYSDFLDKISALMGVENCADEDEKAKQTTEAIANYNPSDNRFLLVIDDLDSLRRTEQQKIIDFVQKIDADIFKTIFTTRQLYDDDAEHLRIRELDEENSLKYAEWVYTKKMEGCWEKWPSKEKAEEAVRSLGRGNPLRIQTILTWVNKGLTQVLKKGNYTDKEMDTYLYNTVKNILDQDAQRIFGIIRQIYGKFTQEYKENEIPINLVKYLCAGLDIEEENFQKSYTKLKDLLLLREVNPNRTLKLYDIFVIDKQCLTLERLHLPLMYSEYMIEYIAKKMENAQNQLAVIWAPEKLLIGCIKEMQQEGIESFDTVVAVKIMEKIADSESAANTEKEEAEEWLKQYSISEKSDMNQQQQRESEHQRVLEYQSQLEYQDQVDEIESMWAELKASYDQGEINKQEYKELLDKCKKLKCVLELHKGSLEFERLMKVIKEMVLYG